MRLDLFLAKKFPKHSRASFQKLIDSERIEINGTKAKNARQSVSGSDDIKVFFPHQLTFAKEITDFASNIIFEDENVVIINKPIGLLTHAKGNLADEFTVSDFVKSRMEANGDDVFVKTTRPGIVHRLDRTTSGILIAAKNPEAQSFLQKQFQDRRVKKTYLAIVEKAPKITVARIDLPIGRNPKYPSEFKIDANGKSAITDYKTLEVFADGSALLELKPVTGRTHQLRVHMKHLNSPILGDVVYNSNKTGDRMFLHALELEITIPKTGSETENQRRIFYADLSSDFQNEVNYRRTKK